MKMEFFCIVPASDTEPMRACFVPQFPPFPPVQNPFSVCSVYSVVTNSVAFTLRAPD